MSFMQKIKSLHRIDHNDVFGGVCAGISLTFGIPLWILRVAVVVSAYFFPEVIIAYCVLCLCIPEKHMSKKEYERALDINSSKSEKVKEKTIEEHAQSFDFNNTKEKEIGK